MFKFKLIIIIFSFNFFLASCETIQELSGLTKPEIDDQLVNQTPDLILPPDFDTVPLNSDPQYSETENRFFEEPIGDPNLGYQNQTFVEPEIRNFIPSRRELSPIPKSPSDSIEKFRKQKVFSIGEWVYKKSTEEFVQNNLYYRPLIGKGYNFSRKYIPENRNSSLYNLNSEQENFVVENNDLIDVEQIPISK